LIKTNKHSTYLPYFVHCHHLKNPLHIVHVPTIGCSILIAFGDTVDAAVLGVEILFDGKTLA
jgi:hypothetical protein